MKKIICLTALLFTVILTAMPVQWKWRTDGQTLQITADIPATMYLYQEGTKISATPLKRLSKPIPKDHEGSEVYKGFCIWKFSLQNAVYPLRIQVNWQGCSTDGTCYLPESSFITIKNSFSSGTFGSVKAGQTGTGSPAFEIIRKVSGYLPAEDFLVFLRGGKQHSLFNFSGKGFWLVLLLTLFGGIALNLTPCILPMIPVNLAIIGASTARGVGRREALLRSVMYAAGITIAYGMLGLLAVFGGTAFGSFASGWLFNALISLLFLILGFSMFDLFLIDFSSMRTKLKAPSSTKTAGVFLLGVIAALLAGSCVAPVVIAVLLYTAKLCASGAYYGVLLPFILGLGMGLPWPLIALGLTAAPKPGKWMIHVKHLFGIVIILLGLYYGYLSTELLLRKTERSGNEGKQELIAALQTSAQKKIPLLIDFRANWCKNCLAMERSTLRDRYVQEEMNHFIFIRFDATDMQSEEVKSVLEKFGVSGLPAYLIVQGK